MKHRLLAVVAIVLISGCLFGQEQGFSLAVRNGQLQQSGYSFQLVNTSSKTIAGWTMTVELSNGVQFYEPDSCSLSAQPLPPGGMLPRKFPISEPKAVRITSVLFADGTAAGDLELLETTIEKHWSTYLEWQYWRKRAQDLRSQPNLLAALRTLQNEIHENVPDMPDHDGYSPAAAMVRVTVIAMIGAGVQQITEDQFSRQQVFNSLLEAMQQLENVEGVRAKLFPRSQQRLSAANVFQPSTRELRNPTHLTVLRFEENRHALRIAIRNDTSHPISSWAFRVKDKSSRFSPSVSRGVGNALIQPGWVDVLELQPAPAPSFQVVSLEASFARSSPAAARQTMQTGR